MWLKLTPLRSDNSYAIDSETIGKIYTDSDGDTCIQLKDGSHDHYVKEGLDYLLAVLNKTEVKSADPRDRNVIGRMGDAV